jgi:hypothetical protein
MYAYLRSLSISSQINMGQLVLVTAAFAFLSLIAIGVIR